MAGPCFFFAISVNTRRAGGCEWKEDLSIEPRSFDLIRQLINLLSASILSRQICTALHSSLPLIEVHFNRNEFKKKEEEEEGEEGISKRAFLRVCKNSLFEDLGII